MRHNNNYETINTIFGLDFIIIHLMVLRKMKMMVHHDGR